MSTDPLSDSKIADSWAKNASPWTTAVRKGLIESRKLSTDQAVIDAVLSRDPHTVIDLGCGEGWLTRNLSARGLQVTGIDMIPELIQEAQCAGGGDFQLLSYDQVVSGNFTDTADVIVCNFSLLGKEPVEAVIPAVSRMLNPYGSFIVQTPHPLMACGDAPYRDGWREGSWDGFGSDFTDPAPWYFRTLEGWIRLFQDSGLQLRELREPVNPKSGKPASVIFITGSAEK